MSDFAKVLYEKFFMRDFMGKLGPGAVVLVMVGYLLCGEGFDISRTPIALLWIAGLPFAYMIGLSIQILSELLGVHSASPRPRYIVFFPKQYPENEDLNRRTTLIGKATDTQWTVNAKEQRERFVVLKEASGNMSMAVFIGLVLAWSGLGGVNISIFLNVAGIVVVVVLYLSHRIHASRQATYETNVLEEAGLLSKDEANTMRRGWWLT